MPYMIPPKEAVNPMYGIQNAAADRPVLVTESDSLGMLEEGWIIVQSDTSSDEVDEDGEV